MAAPSPQVAGAAADPGPVAAIATALAAGAAGLAAAQRRQSVKGAAARRAKQVKLCAVSTKAPPVTSGEASTDMSDEFVVAILGDLHLDPRKMEDYETGREHVKAVLAEQQKNDKVGAALVSLGDLGESKSVRPEETQELFAGTTECHELANGFLSSFGVPYEVIGGNHDLEGIDEFKTDEENLEAFLRIHKKPSPQFCRQVADKVLLVGLSSTVFRAAKYTSHEVTIDDEQVRWFEELVKNHPAVDGWKVFVFSHAPPIGSGLRVLQENHVVNGCCWLNHAGKSATRFIKIVREHRCIKGWFSGHFHLGQDYEDSITFPTIPREVGPYPNRGSCVFVQTSVMRKGTSRDKRQQSRFLRGNKDGFEICTINHADGGKMRVDAAITYSDCLHEVGVYAHEHEELRENTSFVKVYTPTEGDDKFMKYDEEEQFSGPVGGSIVSKDTTNWWYMSCGRVLGIYAGRLIEYDPSTLAPLGLVVGADELIGKRVFIANSSSDDQSCRVDMTTLESGDIGMEGADCADDEPVEQALLLVDSGRNVTVVQPNDDGSYWRKIVRNKMIRMKEKRRWQAGEAYSKLAFPDEEPNVLSSWGPYTSIVGTAKETGVKGLTTQKKIKEAWDLLGGGRIVAWREMGDELRDAFCKLDKDKSGYIGPAELKAAVGMLDPSCDEQWILDMMKLADTDGDNQVSLEEFARLMLFQRIRKAAPSKKAVRG